MNFANYLLLGLFVVASLWAVLTPTLLRGAIALAASSAVLTALMFQMDAPLAGVFELSVCAGLITVVFVSAISLTAPLDTVQRDERRAARRQFFIPGLAFFLAQAALIVAFVGAPAAPGSKADAAAKPAVSATAKADNAKADNAKADKSAAKTPFPAGKATAETAASHVDVRTALWDDRRVDLLGQILIIFAGVFGVVILFREERTRARKPLFDPDRPQPVRLMVDGQVIGILPVVPEKLEEIAAAAPAEVPAKPVEAEAKPAEVAAKKEEGVQ